MPTEDRLFTLLGQARQQRGDAILHQPAELTALLTSQAPDLFGEIQALADAIAANVGARIAAAPNGDEEASRVAAEIAARDRLSIAVVTPAVAVARRLGPIGGAPAMPPAGGAAGWAGDSQLPGAASPAAAPTYPQPGYPPQPGFAPPPGYPPQPGYPPAPSVDKPFYQRPPVLAGGAIALALLGYLTMHKEPPQQPAPNGPSIGPIAPGPAGPAGPTGPDAGPAGPGPAGPNAPSGPGPADPNQPQQGGGGGSGQLPPALAAPGGQLPSLPLTATSDGTPAILFSINAGSAAIGVVTLPKGGWDNGAGQMGFMRPGGQQLETKGLIQFQRGQSTQNPQRLGQPHWDQDGLGVGQICVGFQGQGGTDVQLSGATMCLLDASCQRPLACGALGGGTGAPGGGGTGAPAGGGGTGGGGGVGDQ